MNKFKWLQGYVDNKKFTDKNALNFPAKHLNITFNFPFLLSNISKEK